MDFYFYFDTLWQKWSYYLFQLRLVSYTDTDESVKATETDQDRIEDIPLESNNLF